LEGQRVLIVEDCYLMADALQDILTAAGATVVGAANSVGTALRMIEALQIDMACLDVNLGCENRFPLGDELTSRGIPFVFVTACSSNMLPPIHRARPLVSKPLDPIELVHACQAAALRQGAGRVIAGK
jgi:DNA-binding response OmpR family regulator